MREIQVEGMRYLYLARSEGLPQGIAIGKQIRDAPLLSSVWDTILKDDFNNMRLILISYLFQPEILYIHFLHWDDGTDLDGLDKKVVVDAYTNEDFRNAAITTFGRTWCTECNWEGYTLVLFNSEAYIAQPELEQDKIRLRQQRQGFLNCPNCTAKFRQMVVKTFDTSHQRKT